MPAPPNKPNEPIQHVIVLMMENRSFDHMLGGLSGVIDGLDGPPKAGEPARTNKVNGKTYKQTPARTALSITTPSTSSSTPCTNSITTMAGLVADFAKAYPFSARKDREEIMKYFAGGALPVLHTLANNFLVCDKWFSSLPGPTWPNRFFVHSGTSIGRVSMPEGILDANLHWYDQTTLLRPPQREEHRLTHLLPRHSAIAAAGASVGAGKYRALCEAVPLLPGRSQP